ncbi:hypothetical protein [Levilactobacillus sp. N40-8-2]|uniref:hypothetical protein n=1 Tax=Levilactobacillus muriae TaxID=3238987 RepID=UPI0038B36A75
MQHNRETRTLELSLTALCLGGPMLILLFGTTFDASYLGTYMLGTLLTWGIVGLIGTIIYATQWRHVGWNHLPRYRQVLTVLYTVAFVCGLWRWLALFEILPAF